jgi:1-acyl-sn-glycerol-3-phosphate acyltransferase
VRANLVILDSQDDRRSRLRTRAGPTRSAAQLRARREPSEQRTGHLLVDRKNPGADIVEKMGRLVSESHSLIVFPEGTRSVDGRVGRFKKGSFVVAIEAQLPVVPVSVAGSRFVMSKGQLMVRPGDVRVIVHEPIPTAGVTRQQVIEFGNHVRDVVRSAVDEPAASGSQ